MRFYIKTIYLHKVHIFQMKNIYFLVIFLSPLVFKFACMGKCLWPYRFVRYYYYYL